MRRWKRGEILLLLALFLCLGAGGNVKAAGEGFPLIAAVKAQPPQAGKWMKNKKGYRFRYTASGKYAKNTWLAIGNKIYFVNKKGYRVTGFKKYRKSTYYLDAKGRLLLGWQTIEGERYYFSKETGAMLTGWNKIGKKEYYFSDKGVMQKNLWIGDRLLGKKGCLQKAKRIFVGDSRTVGLQEAVGSSDTYIAKWGQGYEWFVQTGRNKLEKTLKEYPYSAVIFNLGVNDMGNVEAYVREYQELQADYPKARFYFMSLNPVEETFLRASGYGSRDNASIEVFNDRMKQVFGSFYINTYDWMIEQEYVLDLPHGHGTTDGLHYIDIVYQMLYGFVTARVK